MNKENLLKLCIADMPIQIESDTDQFLRQVSPLFEGYKASVDKPLFTMRINSLAAVEKYHPEDGIEILKQNGRFVFANKRMNCEELGSIYKTKKICELNMKPRTMKYLFYPSFSASCGLFFAEAGGFMVHSAGVIDDGRASIFVGASQSGKTTVASLLGAKGLNVISDEKIVIRKKKDQFMAYAFPWHNDKNQAAPLKNIVFLKKSGRVVFKKLDSTDAITRIFPQVTLNIPDRGAAREVLHTLDVLFKKIPAYEMEFPKNDSFYPILKEMD